MFEKKDYVVYHKQVYVVVGVTKAPIGWKQVALKTRGDNG